MNIAILGFGKEGKSVLKFLRESPAFRKSKIVICDRNANARTDIYDKNEKFRVGENYLKNLGQFNIVFRSPGVPYNLPEIQSALRKGAVFSSATKLFFDLCPANIIGVTGTKGKSTTSTLIFKILKRAGFDARLAGNIGKSALEILPKLTKHSWVVLELSSFQLQDLGKSLPLWGLPIPPFVKGVSEGRGIFRKGGEIPPPGGHSLYERENKKSLTPAAWWPLPLRKGEKSLTASGPFLLGKEEKSPRIAVVLDTFPDHLDAHKNIKEYLSAKTNIVKYQKDSDAVFYFKDNPWSSKIANKSRGKKIAIAGENFGVKKNLVMASLVAAYLGCPTAKIYRTLKNFKGLEHRLELARQIGNIRFYNDSASTNPHTAAAAISSFDNQLKAGSLILVCGGKDKNLDYAPLAQTIKVAKSVKSVILFGENKSKIEKQLEDKQNEPPRNKLRGYQRKVLDKLEQYILRASEASREDSSDSAQLVAWNHQVKIETAPSLESAVKLSYEKAKLLAANRELPVTILFSPGSASFDMFKDYKDRGKKFKSLVNKIEAGAVSPERSRKLRYRNPSTSALRG